MQVSKTIGIVAVAFFAARAARAPPLVAITETLRSTSAAAKPGRRSNAPSAQRYSIVTFCPMAQPPSSSPRSKASTSAAKPPGDPTPRKPIAGISSSDVQQIEYNNNRRRERHAESGAYTLHALGWDRPHLVFEIELLSLSTCSHTHPNGCQNYDRERSA